MRGLARVRWVAVALAAVTAIAWLALWRPPRDDIAARSRLARLRPSAEGVNVVFVTLDTTRADRLGCYGFKGIETPQLDALAKEGLVFDAATATVPLTLPSHSAIFTGKIPPHHGVRDNGGFFLDEKEITLAERFKAAGYATGGFIAAWVLDSKWGIAQGFDSYDDKFDLSQYKVLSLGTVQKPGDQVMTSALSWLERVKGGKFFAWVHLYDPHSPYDPPEPFASRYRGQPYLGEIAYADSVVGRLTDFLRQNGLLDHTIVLVTGDHGESLGEHGEGTHGFFIYDSTTHVPLIVRTPWKQRGRVATQVSSVDIFPTLLDLAGLAPQPGIDGRSLARAFFDPQVELGHVAYSETYYPRFHYGWQHLAGLRDGRRRFIEAPTPELYDLGTDPGESRNVYKAFSKTAEELRASLRALAGEAGAKAPERQQLDPETLQRLAALGYVGNTVDVKPDAVLPDPKDKLALYTKMVRARDLGQADKLDEAIATMRGVVTEDPNIVDAHLNLGNWLMKARRLAEAESEFKAVLALRSDNEVAMINLARLYRNQGRFDAALEGYRSALKLDPRSPQNWYQLATLFLDEGRVKEAETTFRQALEANPKMGAAHVGLGVIAWSRGARDDAEHQIRAALALEPEVRTGRFNLARIEESKGRLVEAEALYREEVARYSDNGKAWFNLAQLQRQRGDREGFLAELQAGVDKASEFGACYFFLARERLSEGKLEQAADLARRGLEAEPRSETAPLGHYVLADVFDRRGERKAAEAEAAKARKLEAALAAHPRPAL